VTIPTGAPPRRNLLYALRQRFVSAKTEDVAGLSADAEAVMNFGHVVRVMFQEEGTHVKGIIDVVLQVAEGTRDHSALAWEIEEALRSRGFLAGVRAFLSRT
jgi:hypothetical protein